MSSSPNNNDNSIFINISKENYFNEFFEDKIWNKEFEENSDKKVVREEFIEYIIGFSYADKIRLACYQKKLSIKHLVRIADKSENYTKRLLSELNKKLNLDIKKIDGLNHYTTSKKGLSILIASVSAFFRKNKYMQQIKQISNDNVNVVNSKEIIKRFHSFISNQKTKQIKRILLNDEKSFILSFSDLCEYDFYLADELLSNPKEIISIFEETLSQFSDDDHNDTQSKIIIRITDLPETENIKIGSHREEHINKLVSFEGIIRRKSDVKPRLKTTEYLCTNPSCNFSQDKIIIPQFEEKEKKLKCCPKCKSGVELINKHLEDSMFLILEQDFTDRNSDFDSKKIHIKIDADLTNEKKYNKLKISGKVKIIGILKCINSDNKVEYDYILNANNIIFIDDDDDIIITKEDIEEFKEFAKKEDCFEQLTKSYLPKIYNNEEIKQALLLQHIGSSFDNERNDSHILLLGDPSTAKTEMITESLTYGTRYVYASGTSSTKAGMTATTIKDELTGAWVLEPGVLPRANGGIAGLDEMDKLNKEDADCMTEALEQQTISVNKANISAKLQTKCSFLAGANPKFSKFRNDLTIDNQINFNSALLSRFDLIFLLKDKADDTRDKELIDHILDGYDTENKQQSEKQYDKEFIKKYIYYCKTNFNPKLTDNAKKLISEYYVKMRKYSGDSNIINFTPRQIKGVIRFASAYAKFHQKTQIINKHIKFAFDLFNFAYDKLGSENTEVINE